MKKSAALTPLPSGVVTETRPEDAPAGTFVVRLVAVAVLVVARTPLKAILLFEGVVWKFVPVMVTVSPTTPATGLKPVTFGTLTAPTVKGLVLAAVPAGEVTETGPVVAPAGTLVTICVFVDESTCAVTPLNFTVFCDGVSLKPVP